MTPLFASPRQYKLVALIVMAVNIGNIICFGQFLSYWLDRGELLQGVFVVLFHFSTILLLSFGSARITLEGSRFRKFIDLMESKGFVYDKHTKDFRPGSKF
ncbi:hypothetical protein HO291_003502 [Salmonella enterica]|nr:hypothetical protein [Salmonella enterica]